MTRSPLRASSASACRSNVDLPIPGSPPISTADPGTNPPPATLSSSPIPVTIRGGCASPPLSPTSLLERPLGRLPPLAPETGTEGASSTMLFQAPQLSHCPDHLAWEAPQDWQTKLDKAFATGTSLVVAVPVPVRLGNL